jgi:hypothetical protein
MAINLKDFCKNIANSIRAKEGSSDLISPMDFAQRIDNLQVGGTDGGDNQIIYLNIKAYVDYVIEQMGESMLPMMLKTLPGCVAVSTPADDETRRVIVPLAYLGTEYLKYIDRCAIATNFLCIMENNEINSADLLPQLLQIGCFEITKEQFYDLTT